MEKDQDDANNVIYWVAEMEREEHNPVLCFKSQGESSDHAGVEKNYFLLGIQTEFQQDLFVKYARGEIRGEIRGPQSRNLYE